MAESKFVKAAKKLAARHSPDWSARRFRSTLHELIVQSIWYKFEQLEFPPSRPSRDDYIEAAIALEEDCLYLEAWIISSGLRPTETEIVEALWLMQQGVVDTYDIPCTYNQRFTTHLTFHADGSVDVDDGEEYFRWTVSDGASDELTTMLVRIYTVLDEVTKILKGMPWEDLREFGGRRAIINALLLSSLARGYIKKV